MYQRQLTFTRLAWQDQSVNSSPRHSLCLPRDEFLIPWKRQLHSKWHLFIRSDVFPLQSISVVRRIMGSFTNVPQKAVKIIPGKKKKMKHKDSSQYSRVLLFGSHLRTIIPMASQVPLPQIGQPVSFHRTNLE